MKLSVTYLGIKENLKKEIIKLSKNEVDYIHVDVMDGEFVDNKTYDIQKIKFLKRIKKPLDVHLMVKDIFKYIDEYKKLKPAFITFHYEATKDHLEVINYIKQNNIKAGISINPSTPIEDIIHLLEHIDLVLVMSVNPGYGGQLFIDDVYEKIDKLNELKKEYSFLISVDGGINDINIKKIKADIFVVGTFITNNEYKRQIDKLKSIDFKQANV